MAAPKGNQYAVGAAGGVPKAIETPELMWQYFHDYKSWCEENPILVHDYVGKDADEVHRQKQRPLTYEGFCNHLEDRDIIKNPIHYFTNFEGRYKDFIHVCSRIKNRIRQDQIEGGLVGIYNPSITQRLNNIVEKVETDNKHHHTGLNMIFQQSPGCDPLTKPDADPED